MPQKSIHSERGYLIRSAANGEDRSMPAVLSTGMVARDNHMVDPKGWTYARSVPLVDTHRDIDAGIRSVLGNVTYIREGKAELDDGVSVPALLGQVNFAEASVNPDAEVAFQLYRGGFADSLSVSFIPIEYEPARDRRSGAMNIFSAELLEVSVCAVPSDTSAKILARAIRRQLRGSGTTADRRAIAEAIQKRIERDDAAAREHETADDRRRRALAIAARIRREETP
jgi:hypothetical protein